MLKTTFLRTKDPKCRILGLFQIKYGHNGWNFRGARLFFSSKYWFIIPQSEQQEKNTNSDRPGMKKKLWKNWDPNPKKIKKKIFYSFCFYFIVKKNKNLYLLQIFKSRTQFSRRKHKNAKMSISWNFEKFSDVKIRTFFRNEIASISLQILILRLKLGRHKFFGRFWASGRSKIFVFRDTRP